jgi:hypothetical protein
MTVPNSSIIIIVVIAFAFYLIYNQKNQQILPYPYQYPCPKCEHNKKHNDQPITHMHNIPYMPQPQPPPQITNVTIDPDADPYSDAIKKQDLYTMYDPLTYPQLRLPREVLEKYNEYYERTGTYPPFNQATQPYLFDNPILNGILIKQIDENEPFNDNIPSSIPLFRVKSAKNTNRYFYYILDQRYFSKVELKIPLDHVKINGIRYNNADFYGIPELFDGDCIEHIPIYPAAKFKVTLYKTYHFP